MILYVIYFAVLITLLALGFVLPFFFIPFGILLVGGIIAAFARRRSGGGMDVPPGAPGEPEPRS
ncbi:MAG TPA: hypothetical protein VKD47_02360 [Miltoncostaeaceae bacterium]|nr:hypothetical protein [Miltoncostaeaceae bacterium]